MLKWIVSISFVSLVLRFENEPQPAAVQQNTYTLSHMSLFKPANITHLVFKRRAEQAKAKKISPNLDVLKVLFASPWLEYEIILSF